MSKASVPSLLICNNVKSLLRWAWPQPRTSHPAAALKQLIPGHGHKLDPSGQESYEERAAFIDEVLSRRVHVPKGQVQSIDWWCGRISEEGRRQRTDLQMGGWGHGKGWESIQLRGGGHGGRE